MRQTGEIGLLKILSEGAVAAGVRRIEAVTGKAALQHVAEGERILNQVAQELQTTPREVVEKLERLQLQIKQLERENASLQEKLAASSASELVERAETIDGLKVLVSEVTARDASALRTIGDQLKTKLGSGVIVLGSKVDDKVLFLAMVSPEAVDRGIHAGNIVREAAKVAGGGGGGRPDMAQAGGRNPEKLADSLQVAYQAVVNTVTH